MLLWANCAFGIVLDHGALAKYNPTTGEVIFSAGGILDNPLEGPVQFNLYSDNGTLTGVDVSKTTPAYKLQVGTVKSTTELPNALYFWNPDGFHLDDISAGRLVAPGTAEAHLHFEYVYPGLNSPLIFEMPIFVVPEPSTFILAGIAGVALFVVGRRRLAAQS
jgi:hypothetical protein